MSARRRSITVHGMHDDSLAELESHDEFFYGTEAAGDSESDESDGSSDNEPSAQRVRYDQGAASSASAMPELESISEAEEEFLSESEGEDDEVRAEARAAERADQASDMINIGCGCQGTNHYAALEKKASRL